MTFIDKLKSVFVVIDDSKSSSQNQSSQNVSSDIPNDNYKTTPSNENKQKFYELLAGILEKNNFPGYDYFEFKKALQSVSKLGNMEEAMTYKTVFAAAQAMNVNVDYLIKTANDYLNILETEQTKFIQAADQFLNQQQSSKSNEFNNLNSSIGENKNKLEELKIEIEKQEQRLQTLKQELQDVQEKVSSNKADFTINYKVFVDEIKSDIQKMNNHLK